MKFQLKYLCLLWTILLFANCKKDDEQPTTSNDFLQLVSVKVGTEPLDANSEIEISTLDRPIVARFSKALNLENIESSFTLKSDNENIDFSLDSLDNNRTISILPNRNLESNTTYEFAIDNQVKGVSGESFEGVVFRFKTRPEPLTVDFIEVGGKDLLQSGRVVDVSRELELVVRFSHEVALEDFRSNLVIPTISTNSLNVMQHSSVPNTFIVRGTTLLTHLQPYTIRIKDDLQSVSNNPFSGFEKRFYTTTDLNYKFPELTEEELLTRIQSTTFKYFWDFAHPVSGLIRERNTSANTVTSGGSGFGLMVIIVGIERGFITRTEGIQRLQKILDFLASADRFHGVWSHWLNGETGKVIPFSAKDDGGDLVETSFLVMGLLTVRQYLNEQVTEEKILIDQINTLWEDVEWDWHQQGDQEVLYWHWSPNFAWEKNLKIQGYNEALITYILAASSPTHPIPPAVYHNGWAQGGNMVNGNTYYNYNLPLGPNLGGPLFFEHYTFLGIDPRNLSDNYANYWEQCINHTLINRAYCIDNPLNYVGYDSNCWGLTASDGNKGYSAHSPTNDRGVITPTAALSSFPFTPDESKDALEYFYYIIGDKLWGEYGFHDAFNITEGWVADSFLAIDQGPIVLMIENHRTALLWDLLMSCPEVQTGLTNLGFNF